MESIELFVNKMEIDDFKNDDKTSSAVIRKFEILGEATKNISENIKEKNKKIPWKKLAGMRDRLIHAYFGIDYDLVWNAIKKDIPKLKKELKILLISLNEEEEKNSK